MNVPLVNHLGLSHSKSVKTFIYEIQIIALTRQKFYSVLHPKNLYLWPHIRLKLGVPIVHHCWCLFTEYYCGVVVYSEGLF